MERTRVLAIFLSFLRLGITAFGGPAMVVYIRDLSVRRNRWLDEKDFNDGVALCQSIPGATAMQMAAFVGLKTRGFAGALSAYIGFGLPAFLLMVVLSALYMRYHTLSIVASLFSVMQVIVVSLVANATLSLGRDIIREPRNIFLAIFSAVLFAVGSSPFPVILCGAASGALLLGRSKAALPLEREGIHMFHVKHIVCMLLFVLVGLVLLYMRDQRLFILALVMLKVDLFAFGGGFASLPLMLHEIVQVKGWLNLATFMDGIALGQITPGPIVITATFIGYMVEGFIGSAVSTLAIFIPSFVALLFAAPLFNRFKNAPYFMGAVKGIFTTFLGLLLFMTLKFSSLVPWDLLRISVGLVSFAALLKKVDIFYVILSGALLAFFISR